MLLKAILNCFLNIRFRDGSIAKHEVVGQHLLIGTNDYCDIRIPPADLPVECVLITLLNYDGRLYLNNSSQYAGLLIDGRPAKNKTELKSDSFIAIGELATIQIEEITTIRLPENEPTLACCSVELKPLIRQIYEAAKRLVADHTPPDQLNELLKKQFELSDSTPVLVALDELFNLGPLNQLLQRTDITEIMVNSEDAIFIKQKGRIIKTKLYYSSLEALNQTCTNLLASLNLKIPSDTPFPFIDARLENGYRVNIVLPPVAHSTPVITIRCFPAISLTVDDLVKTHMFTESVARFLILCIEERQNIVISGGTDTGKTTLLNALLNAVSATERTVLIEEIGELRPRHSHTISLQAQDRPASAIVTVRDLVRNALRMSPDRIIIGECRGGETLDMLQAMNTGHHGSLTTLHSNSARDCLSRLETMALFSGIELNPLLVRRQIANAIDLVIHLQRDETGNRSVQSIVEITGMERDILLTQELFTTKVEEGRQILKATGLIPKFVDELRRNGGSIDSDLFN